MPIRPFLADTGAFGPEHLVAMGQPFTAALTKLGLHDLKDPMTEIVAHRIITASLAGERNVIKLTEIGAGGRDVPGWGLIATRRPNGGR